MNGMRYMVLGMTWRAGCISAISVDCSGIDQTLYSKQDDYNA